MTPEERSALLLYREPWFGRWTLSAIAKWVFFAAIFGTAVGSWDQAKPGILAASIVVFAPELWRRKRERIRARADAEYGKVERFERIDPFDLEAERASTLSGTTVGGGQLLARKNCSYFEIYPQSRRVVAWDGKTATEPQYVWVSSVAPTAANPHVPALYPARLAQVGNRGDAIRRTRTLVPGEVAEVKQLAARLAKSKIASGLLFTVLAIALSIQALVARTDSVLNFLGGAYLLLAGLFWWTRNRRAAFVRTLNDDLQHGFVALLEPGDARIDRALRDSRVEILPKSKRLWTVDGEAAHWRKRV